MIVARYVKHQVPGIHKHLWMWASVLVCGLVLTACSNDDDAVTPADEVEAQLQQMTLREKVGQMFYIRLESLDPSIEWTTYDDLANIKIQEVTENIKRTNKDYPVGGIILYAWNIDTEEQLARIIPRPALPTTPTSTSRSMCRWTPSDVRATRAMPTSVATPLVRI